MSRRRSRPLRVALLVLLVAFAYSTFIVSTAIIVASRANLPGGGGGPADALRHTTAAALLAHTLHPAVVTWVSAAMERGDDPESLMDRHNNAIGAQLGRQATSCRDAIERARAAVAVGGVGAPEPDRITWLAPESWNEHRALY